MASATVFYITPMPEIEHVMASCHNEFDSKSLQASVQAPQHSSRQEEETEISSASDSGPFHPQMHLAYTHQPQVCTMSDIGLPAGFGVSQVVASESFQLFVPQAVKQMRQEVLSEELKRECGYSSNTTQGHLRVGVERYAPFTYSLWNSPEVLSIISEIAQIDLEPDHINVSSKSEDDQSTELQNTLQNNTKQDEGIAGCLVDDFEDEKVGEIRTRRFEPGAWKKEGAKASQASLTKSWKNETCPFVCVTMLSDATESAGEMVLSTGLSEPVRIKEPQMGYSVILQGRQVQQEALSILSKGERIAMLTSFRPRNDSQQELEALVEKVKLQLDEIRDSKASGSKVNTKKLKQLLKEQTELIKRLDDDAVDDGNDEFDWADDRIGEGDEGFYW